MRPSLRLPLADWLAPYSHLMPPLAMLCELTQRAGKPSNEPATESESARNKDGVSAAAGDNDNDGDDIDNDIDNDIDIDIDNDEIGLGKWEQDGEPGSCRYSQGRAWCGPATRSLGSQLECSSCNAGPRSNNCMVKSDGLCPHFGAGRLRRPIVSPSGLTGCRSAGLLPYYRPQL